MRIAEVSKLTNTPQSTIRAYEKWGLISPVWRLQNKYREYEPFHVTQVKIARAIYGGFLNKRLRTVSIQVIQASVIRDWDLCKEKIKYYQSEISDELERTEKGLEKLKEYSLTKMIPAIYVEYDKSENMINAKQAATLIHTTTGSIRNWERNGLINIHVKSYERRLYTKGDIERMRVIDLMLQLGFNMSSIRRFFVLFDDGKVEEALQNIRLKAADDDILTAADAWVVTLNQHIACMDQLITLLEEKNTYK